MAGWKSLFDNALMAGIGVASPSQTKQPSALDREIAATLEREKEALKRAWGKVQRTETDRRRAYSYPVYTPSG